MERELENLCGNIEKAVREINNYPRKICCLNGIYRYFIKRKIEGIENNLIKLNLIYSNMKQNYNMAMWDGDPYRRTLVDTVYLTRVDRINKSVRLMKNTLFKS